MRTLKKVYLAGQWNEYENSWKKEIKKLDVFEFFDPEVDSRQGNSDEFFPDDMRAVNEADILVANPGVASSEATWIEIGYFLALNTKEPGESCDIRRKV